MMERIKSWVSDYIRSVLESTIRVAVVSSTDPAAATVRVKVPDGDDLISYDLRVLVRKVHKDKDYWMPDIGDQVLCIFLPFGLEQGFVVGSFFSAADPVPVKSQDKRHLLFDDGSWLEYDRKVHNLSGHIKGKVDAFTVDEDANIFVGGSVTADIGQDLIATVSKNAEVAAGTQITLNAPLINLLGNLSSSGQAGGTATETKSANTDHTGNYALNGNLQVNGDINASGSIIDSAGNTNHHTH